MNMKISLEKTEELENGIKRYFFYFSYMSITVQVHIKAKNAELALELATKEVQYELMHAGLNLLNWKEEVLG